ncbi:thioredoxin [Salinarchaeum sp. IM2453]|uniref:thioredoxin n=1 Tax=Salinarchaeum sp. IM2453 TaxID=2862870 RepID=UPI001C82F2B4|nr:thioredoxin [Salinarchaeum sp. IM2453]QZA88678.1 thioredoxin [Salinarchaeum sp. IM2453]
MSTDSTQSSADEPIHITGSSHFDSVIEEHNLVLVDFYADWCGPCKMIEPTLEVLAQDTPVTVAKIDVDDQQQMAHQHGVQGVPTLKLYSGGEEVETMVGIQSEEQLRSLIQQHT